MNSVTALTFATQAFVTLLVILDPPGATPIFLALVGDKSPRERVRLAAELPFADADSHEVTGEVVVRKCVRRGPSDFRSRNAPAALPDLHHRGKG